MISSKRVNLESIEFLTDSGASDHAVNNIALFETLKSA